jgi:KEOPS complex subunit Pcc1
MATRATATILLDFSSKKKLTTLFSALNPEANAPITRRARVKLEQNKLSLVLTVDAKDTVALRATLNTYLRWINSTLNIIDVVENM